MNEHIEVERQLISILLSSKDAVKDWLVSPVKPSYFDESHRHILGGIVWANSNDVLLTRNSYKEYLSVAKKLTPRETAAQASVYTTCLMQAAKEDDFPMLIEKVKLAYVRRKTAQFLGDYRKIADKDGDLAANATLIGNLQALEADTANSDILLEDVGEADTKAKFLGSLYRRKNNPDVRLTCGIPEIDETMNVGFKAGHLTMFCADVGSFKTTIMLNVALNIWKRSGENVLFVPLEMPAEEIIQKIVARETEIPFNLIEHADKLNDQQIKMIAEEMDKWTSPASRFKILDMNRRVKLSQVRREIEKMKMAGFHPRVVVIDYADKLVPDRRQNRNDLELDDTLEDMRQMGKQLGFAVISAAQLARDGLKRVREQKEGKESLGSTDIRGGQVMTANSDTVYAQLRNPSQPGDQLLFFCLKARHGKNIFHNNRDRTILSVKADIGLIESANDVVYSGAADNDLLDGIINPPKIGASEETEDDQPF